MTSQKADIFPFRSTNEFSSEREFYPPTVLEMNRNSKVLDDKRTAEEEHPADPPPPLPPRNRKSAGGKNRNRLRNNATHNNPKSNATGENQNKQLIMPNPSAKTELNKERVMPKPSAKTEFNKQLVMPKSSAKTELNPAKLVFHCQLAHGSPTGLISGFSTVRDVYEKIAQIYEMTADDILFCTLNTFKVDMERLMGGCLGLDDFIFAHVRGTKKEVEIYKSEPALGITITDNGVGKSFVKRIKADSPVDKLSPAIKIGDHFEKLNNENIIGKRHYQVAKMLRDIPVGSTFTVRLIEPLQAGFSFISARQKGAMGGRKSVVGAQGIMNPQCSAFLGSGKQTVRFKAHGAAVIQQAPDDAVLDRLEHVLDTYMGISDKELALSVWDLGKDVTNPVEFTRIMNSSDLADFQIPEDVIFDMWGVLNDWRRGNLSTVTPSGDQPKPPLIATLSPVSSRPKGSSNDMTSPVLSRNSKGNDTNVGADDVWPSRVTVSGEPVAGDALTSEYLFHQLNKNGAVIDKNICSPESKSFTNIRSDEAVHTQTGQK